MERHGASPVKSSSGGFPPRLQSDGRTIQGSAELLRSYSHKSHGVDVYPESSATPAHVNSSNPHIANGADHTINTTRPPLIRGLSDSRSNIVMSLQQRMTLSASNLASNADSQDKNHPRSEEQSGSIPSLGSSRVLNIKVTDAVVPQWHKASLEGDSTSELHTSRALMTPGITRGASIRIPASAMASSNTKLLSANDGSFQGLMSRVTSKHSIRHITPKNNWEKESMSPHGALNAAGGSGPNSLSGNAGHAPHHTGSSTEGLKRLMSRRTVRKVAPGDVDDKVDPMSHPPASDAMLKHHEPHHTPSHDVRIGSNDALGSLNQSSRFASINIGTTSAHSSDPPYVVPDHTSPSIIQFHTPQQHFASSVVSIEQEGNGKNGDFAIDVLPSSPPLRTPSVKFSQNESYFENRRSVASDGHGTRRTPSVKDIRRSTGAAPNSGSPLPTHSTPPTSASQVNHSHKPAVSKASEPAKISTRLEQQPSGSKLNSAHSPRSPTHPLSGSGFFVPSVSSRPSHTRETAGHAAPSSSSVNASPSIGTEETEQEEGQVKMRRPSLRNRISATERDSVIKPRASVKSKTSNMSYRNSTASPERKSVVDLDISILSADAPEEFVDLDASSSSENRALMSINEMLKQEVLLLAPLLEQGQLYSVSSLLGGVKERSSRNVGKSASAPSQNFGNRIRSLTTQAIPDMVVSHTIDDASKLPPPPDQDDETENQQTSSVESLGQTDLQQSQQQQSESQPQSQQQQNQSEQQQNQSTNALPSSNINALSQKPSDALSRAVTRRESFTKSRQSSFPAKTTYSVEQSRKGPTILASDTLSTRRGSNGQTNNASLDRRKSKNKRGITMIAVPKGPQYYVDPGIIEAEACMRAWERLKDEMISRTGHKTRKFRSIVNVVEVVQGLRMLGFDPSLINRVEKSTLKTVIGILRWRARATEKRKTRNEPIRKVVSSIEQRFNTEIPQTIFLDLVADVIPIMIKSKNMYERILGSNHAYTRGTEKHLAQLFARARFQGATLVDLHDNETGLMIGPYSFGPARRRSSIILSVTSLMSRTMSRPFLTNDIEKGRHGPSLIQEVDEEESQDGKASGGSNNASAKARGTGGRGGGGFAALKGHTKAIAEDDESPEVSVKIDSPPPASGEEIDGRTNANQGSVDAGLDRNLVTNDSTAAAPSTRSKDKHAISYATNAPDSEDIDIDDNFDDASRHDQDGRVENKLRAAFDTPAAKNGILGNISSPLKSQLNQSKDQFDSGQSSASIELIHAQSPSPLKQHNLDHMQSSPGQPASELPYTQAGRPNMPLSDSADLIHAPEHSSIRLPPMLPTKHQSVQSSNLSSKPGALMQIISIDTPVHEKPAVGANAAHLGRETNVVQNSATAVQVVSMDSLESDRFQENPAAFRTRMSTAPGSHTESALIEMEDVDDSEQENAPYAFRGAASSGRDHQAGEHFVVPIDEDIQDDV